jgi:hypothetical protein
MSSLRRQFTSKVKAQTEALNMPVKITGYETSVYRDKPTDFVLGVNTLTGQSVKVFLKDKAVQNNNDVTVAALNPDNNHRHAIPVGGDVLFEGSYSQGNGVYYSRYAKKNYSKSYSQNMSNLMGSLTVRNGRNGTDGALFLRVYDPEKAVMVQAKQSIANVYNILQEAFALDFPQVPDSEKFSRSVMVRIKQGDEWATNTIMMPIVKDEESNKNRMSTPEEAIDILKNGRKEKYRNAENVKAFLDGLGEYDSVEMIPVCSLTFGKDEKDRYFDNKTQKMLEVNTDNFEKMDGLTKRSAIYINHMKDISTKLLSYEDEADEIVPTFFDVNIMMYKSKSPEEDEKRPFIVSFGPVHGGQLVPTVEVHDIPTVNFDPESFLTKKFEAFGDLQGLDEQPVQEKVQEKVQEPKPDPEPMTIGDDFDDDLMAEMEGLLNPTAS